ncbi:hypothetical protein [Amycolatopsis jiangsuensis]|uniref:Uncharacterized protein YukE n=1 Tax=Amycolatopsis jiangsuensis TaxID=1181879 RepID=A0A840ISM8_9PSEU|nr:hypothetical protein [Amycolatopsis jiangsuensis]MBB4684148.1 uncharacterized protein YukE [Amycolatopsis jiangsuensis]
MSGNGGYTASTQAMSDASKKLTQSAEDLLDDNPDLGTPAVVEENFGNAHKAHSGKYTEGAKNLSDALNGYDTMLTTLGSNISTGAKTYDSNEDEQTGEIDTAGAF